MPSRKLIVWALTIVAVLASYVFSARTQVNLDHLKGQLEEPYRRQPRAQQPAAPAPQPTPPPAQDFNELRTQVQQLQERVLKLEHELKDFRTPKIIPVNRH